MGPSTLRQYEWQELFFVYHMRNVIPLTANVTRRWENRAIFHICGMGVVGVGVFDWGRWFDDKRTTPPDDHRN